MSGFFVPTENISENEIIINGSDVNHIKNVLRMRTGDEITVNDSKGLVYNCRIASFLDGSILLTIESKEKSQGEMGLRISLFQGLPKADKMELIIQKAVELGVYDIYPVINERSVVKLDDKKSAHKTERWNKISEAAAKQSGRAVIPVVHEPVKFTDALNLAAAEFMEIVLPYENAEGMEYTKQVLNSVTGKDSCGIFIGPEGGFSQQEIEKAQEADAKIISLGKRILRTETAGLYMLSVLGFLCETKR